MREELAEAMYNAAIEKVASDENHPQRDESFVPWDQLRSQAKLAFLKSADTFLDQDFRLDPGTIVEGRE